MVMFLIAISCNQEGDIDDFSGGISSRKKPEAGACSVWSFPVPHSLSEFSAFSSRSKSSKKSGQITPRTPVSQTHHTRELCLMETCSIER
eukprot:758617-Hanusia_phi.AAC.3